MQQVRNDFCAEGWAASSFGEQKGFCPWHSAHESNISKHTQKKRGNAICAHSHMGQSAEGKEDKSKNSKKTLFLNPKLSYCMGPEHRDVNSIPRGDHGIRLPCTDLPQSYYNKAKNPPGGKKVLAGHPPGGRSGGGPTGCRMGPGLAPESRQKSPNKAGMHPSAKILE